MSGNNEQWSNELVTSLNASKLKASPEVVEVIRQWYYAIPRNIDGADPSYSPDLSDFKIYFTKRAGWYSGETVWYLCDPHDEGVITEATFVMAVLTLFRKNLRELDQNRFQKFLRRFHKTQLQQERDLLARDIRIEEEQKTQAATTAHFERHEGTVFRSGRGAADVEVHLERLRHLEERKEGEAVQTY